MLENVKTKQRVVLANGMKATVVDVEGSLIHIRPDGGKYRTRQYSLSGVAYGEPAEYNVSGLIAGNVDMQALEAATAAAKAAEEAAVAAAKAIEDVKSYQETTEMDLGDGKGMVKFIRHINPEGDEGGFVAESATLINTRVGRGSFVGAGCHLTNCKIINNQTIVNATATGLRMG